MIEPWRIGHRYRVPVVRGHWHGMLRAHVWPVIGPVHDDADHLDFPQRHWHLDGRFLSDWNWQTVGYHAARVLSGPRIQVTGNFAGLPMGWKGCAAIVLLQHPAGDHRMDSVPLPPRRLPLRRQPPPELHRYYDRFTFQGRFTALQHAYRNHRLRGPVCPHRGANLTGQPLDPDGCITCPLHGLRWHVRSGALRT